MTKQADRRSAITVQIFLCADCKDLVLDCYEMYETKAEPRENQGCCADKCESDKPLTGFVLGIIENTRAYQQRVKQPPACCSGCDNGNYNYLGMCRCCCHGSKPELPWDGGIQPMAASFLCLACLAPLPNNSTERFCPAHRGNRG